MPGTGAGARPGAPARTWRLVDMHCHLDRMAEPARIAEDAAAAGLAVFDVPVTPAESASAAGALSPFPNVRTGAGLHPWWLADGSCSEADVDMLVQMAARSRFVGEVGLDFGKRFEGSRPVQEGAFRRLCAALAENPVGGRAVSIHAVRAAGTVLDVLQEHGLTQTASCIFHWFSGTSDELSRAREAGCFFSVNARMLQSRRGREYARQVPLPRLLLETDAPPELDSAYPASAIVSELEGTLAQVARLRGMDARELGRLIAQTSTRLLGL